MTRARKRAPQRKAASVEPEVKQTSLRSVARQRRGIQSVEIGFRVLAAVAAEPEPVALGTIARRAALSPPQAHRYLSSLIASGMAHQDAPSGRYELGPQAIQVGLAALARTDVFAQADPAIAAFTRETGRTTLLAAPGPLGPTIVRWHYGRRPVATSLAVGSVLPLLSSATGFVFLAFMSDDEIAGALDDATAVSRKLDVGAVRRTVRRDMFATADELLIPGLRAIAVPILDIQRRPALVVTTIATNAFPRADDADIRNRLKFVCKTLTERLGASWSPPKSSLP